jgi:hypothetical protein
MSDTKRAPVRRLFTAFCLAVSAGAAQAEGPYVDYTYPGAGRLGGTVRVDCGTLEPLGGGKYRAGCDFFRAADLGGDLPACPQPGKPPTAIAIEHAKIGHGTCEYLYIAITQGKEAANNSGHDPNACPPFKIKKRCVSALERSP